MEQKTTGIVQSRYCRPRTVGVVQGKIYDGKEGYFREQRCLPRQKKTRQRKQPHIAASDSSGKNQPKEQA